MSNKDVKLHLIMAGFDSDASMTLSRELMESGKSAYDQIKESLVKTPDFGMEGDNLLEATYHFKCSDRKMLDKLIEMNSSTETHMISIEVTPAKKYEPGLDEEPVSLPAAGEALKPSATSASTAAASMPLISESSRGETETNGAAANTKKRSFTESQDTLKGKPAGSSDVLAIDDDRKLPAKKSPPQASMDMAKSSVPSPSNVETISDSDSYCEIVEPSLPLKKRSKTMTSVSIGAGAVASTAAQVKHSKPSTKILVALVRLTIIGNEYVDDYDTMMENSNMKDVSTDLLALFSEYDAANPGFVKAIGPLGKHKHKLCVKSGTHRVTREGFEYVKSQGIKIKPVRDNAEAQELLLKKKYMSTIHRNIFHELVQAGGSMTKAELAQKKLSKEEYKNEEAQGFKKAMSVMKQTKTQGKTVPFKFQVVDYNSKDVRLTDLAYPLGRPGGKK